MDQVKHPLDWWAYGGYPEVQRHTGWGLARARREVRKAIRTYGWKPMGHSGYEELRRRIMDGELFDHDLLQRSILQMMGKPQMIACLMSPGPFSFVSGHSDTWSSKLAERVDARFLHHQQHFDPRGRLSPQYDTGAPL